MMESLISSLRTEHAKTVDQFMAGFLPFPGVGISDACGTGLISTMDAILQKLLMILRLTSEKAGCTGRAM
jgi:hypothetical protein